MGTETLRKAAALIRERAEMSDAFIASWKPPVAQAVADWLDSTARHLDRGNLPLSRDLHAFRVARAYLGADA